MVDFQRVYKDLSEFKLGTKTITESGTYDATDDNVDAYTSVTVNVSGSSGGGLISKVTVVDLDGTVIDWCYKKEGDTYTLPTPPTHPCLTFHEWVSTAPITNNTITVGKVNVTVGAVYKPSNTATLNCAVLCIEFTEDNLTNGILVYKPVDVWEIDTQLFNNYSGKLVYIEESMEDQYYHVNNSTIHNGYRFYATETGRYYIPLVSTDGNSFPYRAYTGSGIFVGDINSIKGIIFPPLTQPGSFSPRGWLGNDYYYDSEQGNHHLEFVGLPINCTQIVFNSGGVWSPDLKVIIIPSTVSSHYSFFKINKTTCSQNLKYVIANCKNYTTSGNFGQASLAYSSIRSMHINKDNTSLGANLFYHCEDCLEYDFTDFESVPSLAGITAFEGINENCIIKVPLSLEATWKSATNWATYADYIVGV